MNTPRRQALAPKPLHQKLLEGAFVAFGMAITVLVLMRGKVLIALVVALIFAGCFVRLKRAFAATRRV